MTRNIQTVEDMNDAIITYYNQIGEDILDSEKIDSIKEDIIQERKSMGYTYENLVSFMMEHNKPAINKTHPVAKL